MRGSITDYRLKWSVRSKLFLAYFALIVTVGAVSLAWLQPELKDWIEERVEADLAMLEWILHPGNPSDIAREQKTAAAAQLTMLKEQHSRH